MIAGRKITRKDQMIIEYTENSEIGAVRRKDNSFFVPIKKINKQALQRSCIQFCVKGR